MKLNIISKVKPLTILTTILLEALLMGCANGQQSSLDAGAPFLQGEMNEAKSYIPFRDSLNLTVSKVGVDWHLYHLLLTVNEVYSEMEASNPMAYKPQFNMGRKMMFTMNRIPRGRAESPDIVRPPVLISLKQLEEQLVLANLRISKFDSLPLDAHFSHPYVGTLNRKRAKKFLDIHTHHHLEIIRDILGSENGP